MFDQLGKRIEQTLLNQPHLAQQHGKCRVPLVRHGQFDDLIMKPLVTPYPFTRPRPDGLFLGAHAQCQQAVAGPDEFSRLRLKAREFLVALEGVAQHHHLSQADEVLARKAAHQEHALDLDVALGH